MNAAMRGRAVTVAFALCFCISNASEASNSFSIDHRLSKLLTCGQLLGAKKCLTAFSVWRAQKAIDLVANGGTTFDLNVDLDQFPLERYANVSEEKLYSDLCDGTESLLRYRQLALNVNEDYTLRLGSKGNGTLNVDVIQNNGATGRGYMKKLRKKFFNIIPLLLLPGLIMSAILPFVLPALKMMVIGVGILNNMALSGAVFTLLRNNAFNEANRHRIIYVNDGYRNEKHYPVDYHYATSNTEVIGELPTHRDTILLDNTEIQHAPLDTNLSEIQNGDFKHAYYSDTKIKREDQS